MLRAGPAPAPSPNPIHAILGAEDEFTGDHALGVVASSNGGDYYTKAWTGENTGDSTRGTGACTAFRRTLQCNPSGTRDPLKDKGCQEIINADEEGFCECGDYAQFAAVDCNHRPFTCEVMCLKLAVVTKKQAVFRNQQLTPDQARYVLEAVMWANQTDLEALRGMEKELRDYMDRAIKYTTETSDKAKASMKKFLDMMKAARDIDAENARKELEKFRKDAMNPWLNIWKNGQKQIDAGKAIQAKVKEILPFDPVSMGPT